MTGEVRWSNLALADLYGIRDYYESERPAALATVMSELLAAMDLLEQFPSSGGVVLTLRGGRQFRGIVAGRHTIYYQLIDSHVFVVRVWGARRGQQPLEGILEPDQ